MKKFALIMIFAIYAMFAFVPNSRLIAHASKNSTNFGEQKLSISSTSAILVEAKTGTIVYEKNKDEKLPIASMTKLATLAVVFDLMDKGIIKENDLTMISDTAAAVSGSSAFLDAGSKYKVIDLIKTVIIASANDSSVALSELVAGSEEQFVLKMNKFASSLGLANTHFENATGLPADGHYSTAEDMTKIYMHVADNPIFRRFSKVWIDYLVHPTGRKTELVNTNRLIKSFDGIEGGKTGYTSKAKFCLTASARRGETRFVGVVIGASDSKTRFNEMTKLLNYGFSNFESKLVVNKEIPVVVTKVSKSNLNMEVYPEKDSVVFSEKNGQNTYTTDYQIYGVTAPVKKGDVVGKMFVFDENNLVVD